MINNKPPTFRKPFPFPTASARAGAATASAASLKTFAMGGLAMAAGVAAFTAVQPEARPAMCAASPNQERTYIMAKPDGVQVRV